jgi:hypothetical protein
MWGQSRQRNPIALLVSWVTSTHQSDYSELPGRKSEIGKIGSRNLSAHPEQNASYTKIWQRKTDMQCFLNNAIRLWLVNNMEYSTDSTNCVASCAVLVTYL